jgi:MscS family membrane protein
MNDFLHRVIGNNQVKDYLWVVGIIVFVWLISKILSRYLAISLCKMLKRSWKTFDQQTFVDLIITPLGKFILITVCIVSLYRLNFPPELNISLYKYSLQKIFLAIGILLQIATFTWVVMRFIDFIAVVFQRRANLTPSQGDDQLIFFFRDFLKVIIGIFGLMMILHFAFDYHIGSLLTGLSIVGAAVALALRESLENLIASFVIFFDKPFSIGDFVKVQTVSGNVERIGLRSTRIRTTDKSYVTVPNKQMVDSILDNVSKRSQVRGELIVNVNLQTRTAQIEQLVNEIKNYLSSVKPIENYTVVFNDIKQQAFIITVEFFTTPAETSEFIKIKEGLNFFVLRKLEELEIRIAP